MASTDISSAPSDEKVNGQKIIPQSVTVPQAKPINNTWWRRNLSLLSIQVTQHLTNSRRGSVIRLLGNRICVKYDSSLSLADAATLQFVAQYTSVPVPKVYCAFERKGKVYIVMEWIRGEVLANALFHRSEKSKAEITLQLQRMLAELRNLPHPEGLGIANVTGGSLSDHRLPGNNPRFGPCRTIEDFHRHLREGIDHSELYPEINQLAEKHKGTWPICFTHGDLHGCNIVVRGDKVVGIVDWDTAGWYPSYWEYTAACYTAAVNESWPTIVEQFLEPMPEELAMERLREKYFSWMGMSPSDIVYPQ